MRRGTIVAGVTAGAMAIGGAATASAADVAIDFTTGSVQLGSYAKQSVPATTSFKGTIDLASPTLAGQFPASGILIPETVIPSVSIGAYTGPLSISATPKAFSGSLNLTSFSYDLSGSVRYRFVATGGATDLACNAVADSPVTLAGGPIDFVTGGFSATGSTPTPPVSAEDVASGPFCLAFTANPQALPALSQIASAYSGKITIPGLLPAPTAPVVPKPTTPTTSTTPTTPTAPTTVVKRGRLSVSVARPKTVRRGRSTVVTMVLRNTGAGTARTVSLRLAASGKGVTPRTTTKRYATIGAGKTRTFRVRLRTRSTSPKRSKLQVTAKGAGGLSASRSTSLRLR